MHQQTIKITPSTFWVGANDRETDLFEGLWSLPRGIAYNSYLILGEKTVLIDTVKASFMGEFLVKVQTLLAGRPLDYLIINHMEPDHSGSISILRHLYPNMQLVGNIKTIDMAKAFYDITSGIVEVKEGSTLDLGDRQLQFAMIPMVHWPESMITYDTTEKVLFSNDAFGGFSALEGGIFDDEVDMSYYESEILRYFANIVGRYSSATQKAIEKVRALDLKVICPSHGPILRSKPMDVVNLYDKWSKHETEEGVVIVYGSMYGNTKKMTDTIARTLAEEGIQKIIIHDASRSSLSFMVRDIWRFKALVLGSCTYNTELYPSMASLCRTLTNKMMKNRLLGLCGSYSWSRGALAELQAFASRGEWELIEPSIECKSSPNEEDRAQCVVLAQNLAKAMRKDSAL